MIETRECSARNETAGSNQTQVSLLARMAGLLPISALYAAVASIIFAVQRALLPFQLNYEEGNILNAAQRILAGATPYPAPGSFPYTLNSYGLVLYYSVALIVRFAGLSLAPARLLPLAAALVCSLLLSIWIQQETRSWKSGLIFGGLFLAIPVVQLWLPILRADFTGLALSLAGLVLFASLPHYRLLSAPLWALALFTKPTFVAAPAACLLYLALRREWKSALRLSLLLTSLVALGLLAAQRASAGHFAFHVFQTHSEPYLWSYLALWYGQAAVAGVFHLRFAFRYVRSELRERSYSLPCLWLGLASITALITAGKLGSDTNHLLEWLAAVSVCAGLAYHEQSRNWRASKLASAAGALALAAIITSTGRVTHRLDSLERFHSCCIP